MSSHALTSLLLSSASEPNNSTSFPELENNVTSSTTSILTTILSTTPVVQSSTTLQTSTVPSTTTVLPPEDDSHLLFGFCTILFFVGIALVMKIIYSNRKKYRNLTPSIPSWRLSASRSSGSVPAGFALSRDPFAPRTARGEAFASAHYTAVPPSTTARLSQQHDAFAGNSSTEWERQYFEDDTQNEERTSSKLELRR